MICEYGCGQEAKYQFKNGKWCCSKNHRQCPEIKKKMGLYRRGSKYKKHRKPIKLNDNNFLCDYGCKKVAKYYFPISKTYCCSSHWSKCNIIRERSSDRLMGHSVSKKTRQKISKEIIEINKNNIEYRIKQSISKKLYREVRLYLWFRSCVIRKGRYFCF